MQCKQVKSKLADYVVGLLNERERRSVAQHLEQCTSCTTELRALERVDRLLHAVEPEEPPAYLWQSIRARIEAGPQRTRTTFWQGWWTMPRLALGGAAAAAVLAALVYFGVPRPLEEQTSPHESAEQLMHTHQIMSWGDPLSDKAALGIVLASRSPAQEVR